MNCVFVTVFNQPKYVDMFFLLLESIFIYGSLGESTHILVYTSTPFMNRIKQSHLFDEKIKFEINDTYNDLDKACKARLDLFKLSVVNNYNKILYLDTDVLVKDDLNKVFQVCEQDVLYVLEEGRIDNINRKDMWGATLFGDEINQYEDKTAFTSGILLFNNCERMKFLFDKVQEDMEKRPHRFHDQPHIIYNAFKFKLYNNKTLKTLVVNRDQNIHSDKVIHHFPCGPGNHRRKMAPMQRFLNELKDFTITNNIQQAKAYIDTKLLPIVVETGEKLEGNIFMKNSNTTYSPAFMNKAKNISNLVLNKNIKNVMEIGFNSGFSTLLMLLSNPTMRMSCFDLGEHEYTRPCYEELKKTFGDRLNITLGDSTKTLPRVTGTYDLIHIDGGHSPEVATSDIINSYRLSKPRTILIMDDYNFPKLHQIWDDSIIKYKLRNVDVQLYHSPHHDIKYVSA